MRNFKIILTSLILLIATTGCKTIKEKTDAIVIVVSEQRGDVSYIKDGNLDKISSSKKLQDMLTVDLSS